MPNENNVVRGYFGDKPEEPLVPVHAQINEAAEIYERMEDMLKISETELAEAKEREEKRDRYVRRITWRAFALGVVIGILIWGLVNGVL